MDITVYTAELLEKYINTNGPESVKNKPMDLYNYLAKELPAYKKVLRALLCAILADVVCYGKKYDENLSKEIQNTCGFNKDISDEVSKIIAGAFSKENLNDWKEKEKSGLTDFINSVFVVQWDGLSYWGRDGGGYDCTYQATIKLQPTDKICENRGLKILLKENSFISKEKIGDFFEEELCEYLDGDFEEYCDCDDYYPPVCEEYEIEYAVKKWCDSHGFELVECNGDGELGDYERSWRY